MKWCWILVGLMATLATRVSVGAENSPGHFVVALRLPEWKSMHFDDSDQAKEHAEAVKKMGAEVRINEHEGHIDVRYRTNGWKALRVKTDDLAHSWNDWLRKSGFETLHGHDPDHVHQDPAGHDLVHAPAEVVLVRTTGWVSQHVGDAADAADFAVIAEALRCEVQKADHSGHTDVRFRCPEWTAVEFPTHEAAAAWTEWFASRGFQARHQHNAYASPAAHSH
ncbi:hypothetical protein NG895_09365 [Aeoliella sp. ICT_H6.2]|uniref:Secreted protein n=1 Tax=Aeoliella straminimaris TaxID=2954799 RepID=A0A9X2F8A0_9BACT|nr:hypothetical protein [Aeoliella straminimaris]MCO6044115.1 hypothetical protein [Aeoliella straminimaris]